MDTESFFAKRSPPEDLLVEEAIVRAMDLDDLLALFYSLVTSLGVSAFVLTCEVMAGTLGASYLLGDRTPRGTADA